MNAAIVAIGNELLGGFTLDSNSTWIARKLLDKGILTTLKLTVGDSIADIIHGLRISSEKCDIILSTGGLGPTHDDVTKRAFCRFVGADLVFDEAYFEVLRKRFERRGMKMPQSNREQAYVPDRGDVIPNPIGSALGLKFVEKGKRYYVMPGVPSEMKAIMEETVLPELSELSSEDVKVTTIRTTGIMESALFDKLQDTVNDSEHVQVSFIPGFMGVDVRLMSRDKDAVSRLANHIIGRVGDYVYAEDWERLEEAVGRMLREKGLTISTAESCTGGLLSDRFTNVAGSSGYFVGGVVTYSNEAKMHLLGVRHETLTRFGAVSEQTAIEMAQGARSVFQTEIAVSITGIAGPSGGSAGKPIGLTYIGLDFSGDIQVKRFIFAKERRFNKELAAQAALNMVRLAIA